MAYQVNKDSLIGEVLDYDKETAECTASAVLRQEAKALRKPARFTASTVTL